jgi:hypothetical protein
MIKECSNLALIKNVYHSLSQASTMAYGNGHGLADESYLGFSTQQQKEVILTLQLSFERIYDAALWMTLWLFARRGKKTVLFRPIPNQEQIAAWSERELIDQVHKVLESDAPAAFDCYLKLAEGHYGFSCEPQKQALLALQYPVTRMRDITLGIQLWLDNKRKRNYTRSKKA